MSVARILSKVEVSASGCWNWTGARLKAGYGILKYQGKTTLAHRAVYHLRTGEFPEVVMHSCDNPSCVNPLHLSGGTQKENIADRDRKGRRSPLQKGDRYGN